jgi:hypothetical protein
MAARKGSIPSNKLFTRPTEIDKIIRLYRSGLSINKIGLKLGCHKAVIRRILRENGEPLRFFRPSPELTAEVVRLYKDMSGPEVALLLKTTPTTIYARLRKAGESVRNCREYASGTDCDHEYFDRIDTEEKAYWLFFMNADGCVTDYGDVVLSLKAADALHVEKFRQALRAVSVKLSIDERPKRKIIHGRECWTKHASVTVRSPRMVDALIKHGIPPRKTGKTIMPRGVPPHFVRHGWRGAIDGDGWVAMSKGSGKRLAQAMIGLTGDRAFVEAWQAFCGRHVATTASIRPNQDIWKFNVTDSFAITIGQLLYKDATVMLERKHDGFLRILESYAVRLDRWGNPTRAARLARLGI